VLVDDRHVDAAHVAVGDHGDHRCGLWRAQLDHDDCRADAVDADHDVDHDVTGGDGLHDGLCGERDGHQRCGGGVRRGLGAVRLSRDRLRRRGG
jgi:sugar lactone lactonase YvrE